MGRKIGVKNKNHVKYICSDCLKNFGCRKYEYENHINKKKPCKKNNIFQNNVDLNNYLNNLNDLNNNLNDLENSDNSCDLENLDDFEHLDDLDDLDDSEHLDDLDDSEHLDKNDKDLFLQIIMKKMDCLIKQNDEFKKDISKLKKDNDEFKKNNDEFKKNNDEFKKDIIKLKEDNDKLISQLVLSNKTNKTNKTNKSNKIINNTINLNFNINNFNNMDLSTIDKKYLITTLLNQTGKQIILKAVKDCFVNPSKPENHNIFIADKNRKYVRTYNDGKWNTNNFNVIDTIINNFVDIYKLSIEEIKQNPQVYERIKNIIQTKMKYLDNCDVEYLAELEDEQENNDINNKNKIKRWKEFYEMVYDDVINLLYDNKDIVLKTHKNLIPDNLPLK